MLDEHGVLFVVIGAVLAALLPPRRLRICLLTVHMAAPLTVLVAFAMGFALHARPG